MISPVRLGIEICGRQLREMAENIGPQICDNALAQGGHEVKAKRAGYREYRHHENHHREIAVDQLHGSIGEAEVDHSAHRHWNDQSGECGDDQRNQRCGRATPITRDIGEQPGQRLEFQLWALADAGAPETSSPRPSLEKLMRCLLRPASGTLNASRPRWWSIAAACRLRLAPV